MKAIGFKENLDINNDDALQDIQRQSADLLAQSGEHQARRRPYCRGRQGGDLS